MDTGSYKEISRAESLKLPAENYRHAAHGLLYAPWSGKLFGRYTFHYAIMMQVRFDGTLGFPGGILDTGETPEQAVTREFAEEVGEGEEFTEKDHVVTHYSEHTKFCLHFYAKEVAIGRFHEIERRAPTSVDWGEEVLGVVRCPLYTLPNGLGFPAFLRHQFIGPSKQQLLVTIERRGLLTREEIRVAVEKSGSVHGIVTVDEIDY